MTETAAKPQQKADPEFVALAQRMGVPSRAKGLQTALAGYLLRHDLLRELQKTGFSPLLADKLMADSFVQEIYEARLGHLRAASEALDGPVLRGLALTNPSTYYRLSTLLAATAATDAPLSSIGQLIDSILQERNHDKSTPDRSAEPHGGSDVAAGR